MSETGTGRVMTIEDLRGYLSEWVKDQTRQASPADLVEALLGLGAEKVRTHQASQPFPEGDVLYYQALEVSEPGSYIVWRIEADDASEGGT